MLLFPAYHLLYGLLKIEPCQITLSEIVGCHYETCTVVIVSTWSKNSISLQSHVKHMAMSQHSVH